MKQFLFATLAGLCFGAGLAISGMTDPQVVLAFLTLGAQWNPALMLVMGSAVCVSAMGFWLARRRTRPWADASFHEPTATQLDARLMLGAGIFGVGWALGGYCPGPAIVGAASMDYRALIFLGAYLGGLLVFELTLGQARLQLFMRQTDG
jgi:uncharacterized membrane protein YedE/YeeE